MTPGPECSRWVSVMDFLISRLNAGNVVASVRDSSDFISQNGAWPFRQTLTALAPPQANEELHHAPENRPGPARKPDQVALIPPFQAVVKKIERMKRAGCPTYPFPSGMGIRLISPSAFGSLASK